MLAPLRVVRVQPKLRIVSRRSIRCKTKDEQPQGEGKAKRGNAFWSGVNHVGPPTRNAYVTPRHRNHTTNPCPEE